MLASSLVRRRAGAPSTALLLLVLTVTGIMATTSPASAHEDLASSSPVHGARLSTAPAAVRLQFSDRVDPRMTTVVVSGPQGALRTEPPRTAGTVVAQALPAVMTEGAYVAAYRVVSADGHPVSGALRFTVTGGATGTALTRPSPSDRQGLPQRLASSPDARADRGTPDALPVLGVAGGVLTVLTPAVTLLSRRRRGQGGSA